MAPHVVMTVHEVQAPQLIEDCMIVMQAAFDRTEIDVLSGK